MGRLSHESLEEKFFSMDYKVNPAFYKLKPLFQQP